MIRRPDLQVGRSDLQVGRSELQVRTAGRPDRLLQGYGGPPKRYAKAEGLHYITIAFLFWLWAAPAVAQSFDPSYRFRTLETEHFRIHFHQGEDHLAARLAAIAEETWQALKPLSPRPPLLTHVVLVDQSDLANAFAAALPRDAVVIYSVWPAGSEFLKTDDWLEIAFVHEFTHILHLDRSEGWARVVRAVLGRSLRLKASRPTKRVR
jgi:hypothetical protein